MEMSVREAAEQLRLDSSRVQQLLRSGRLPGRRLGSQWLVDADSVALMSSQVRLPGRPMAPARAWGLLDLLDGGSAPWLSSVARSQVRHQIRSLEDAGPDRWRAVLAARSEVLRAWVHPAALSRLSEPSSDVLPGGPALAAEAGADLVAVAPDVEIYVRSAEVWRDLHKEWHIQVNASSTNLRVRIPRGVWPFEGTQRVGGAALAADLLESGEPRALRAAVELLQRRAEGLRRPAARPPSGSR